MGLIYTIPYVMLVMVVGFLALFYYQADTDEDKNRITLDSEDIFSLIGLSSCLNMKI